MPVESTLSTKELRKTWTGKSSRAGAFSRSPYGADGALQFNLPEMTEPWNELPEVSLCR